MKEKKDGGFFDKTRSLLIFVRGVCASSMPRVITRKRGASAMSRRRNGQSLSEYGLLIALIAVASIIGLYVLGGAVGGIFSNIGSQVVAIVGDNPVSGTPTASPTPTPTPTPSPTPPVPSGSLSFPGIWDDGSASNRLSPIFSATDGSTVSVSLSEAINEGNIGVYCLGGTNAWSDSGLGLHTFIIIGGSDTCFVYSWDGSYYYRPDLTGAGTYQYDAP
jgi:Flp pilus assembly pilin Flp